MHVHASGVPQTSQSESGPQLVLFNLAVLMALIFIFLLFQFLLPNILPSHILYATIAP